MRLKYHPKPHILKTFKFALFPSPISLNLSRVKLTLKRRDTYGSYKVASGVGGCMGLVDDSVDTGYQEHMLPVEVPSV